MSQSFENQDSPSASDSPSRDGADLAAQAKKLARRLNRPRLKSIEYVHQTRIRLRAFSATLAHCSSRPDQKFFKKLGKGLRAIRQSLSDLRDLDVAIGKWMLLVHEIDCSELQTLLYRLVDCRRRLLRDLKRRWKGKSVNHSIEQLRKLSVLCDDSLQASEDDSVAVLESELNTLVQSLHELASGGDVETQTLHEARIRCKKLRYRLEAVPGSIDHFREQYSKLKEAQERLGAIHDAMNMLEALKVDRLIRKTLSKKTLRCVERMEQDAMSEALRQFQAWQRG